MSNAVKNNYTSNRVCRPSDAGGNKSGTGMDDAGLPPIPSGFRDRKPTATPGRLSGHACASAALPRCAGPGQGSLRGRYSSPPRLLPGRQRFIGRIVNGRRGVSFHGGVPLQVRQGNTAGEQIFPRNRLGRKEHVDALPVDN